MVSVSDVVILRSICDDFELEGRELVAEYSDEQLSEMFNGIGAASFPDWLRAALDALHPSLLPVAFIHDIEWSLSDGTKESFTESNDRFRRNGYKVAKTMFGWYNPRRYVVMWDARRFAMYCQKFGWGAWMAQFEFRQSREPV